MDELKLLGIPPKLRPNTQNSTRVSNQGLQCAALPRLPRGLLCRIPVRSSELGVGVGDLTNSRIANLCVLAGKGVREIREVGKVCQR